jgi:hypothetical protein
VIAESRVDGKRRPVERNHDQARQIEHLFHLLGGEVRRRTGRRLGVAVFRWVGFDQGDQFLEVHRRHRRMNRYNIGRGRDQRDWSKILERIVAGVAVHTWIDDEAGRDRDQGVAVRRGAFARHHAKIATGAGHVLDVDLLAEHIG